MACLGYLGSVEAPPDLLSMERVPRHHGPFLPGGHGSVARTGLRLGWAMRGSTLVAEPVCGVPRLKAYVLWKYLFSRHLEFSRVY